MRFPRLLGRAMSVRELLALDRAVASFGRVLPGQVVLAWPPCDAWITACPWCTEATGVAGERRIPVRRARVVRAVALAGLVVVGSAPARVAADGIFGGCPRTVGLLRLRSGSGSAAGRCRTRSRLRWYFALSGSPLANVPGWPVRRGGVVRGAGVRGRRRQVASRSWLSRSDRHPVTKSVRADQTGGNLRLGPCICWAGHGPDGGESP